MSTAKRPAQHSKPSRKPAAATRPVSLALGALFLLVSAAATLAMVLDHLGGLALPGCGQGSPCAAAAASVWGKVPVVGWPVSFVGFAYFSAMLVGWLVSGARLTAGLRWVAHLAALTSLFYTGLVIFGGYHCWYCLASHLGNFAFWIVLLRTGRGLPVSGLAPPAFAGVVVLAVGGLSLADMRERGAARERAEQAFQQADRQLADAAGQSGPLRLDVENGAAPPAKVVSSFTGRYRLGPAISPMRIVIFSDYQCPGCATVEKQVMDLLAARPEVTLTVMHYPLNQDCNPHGEHKHSNACVAARAAEAAGLLGGAEAFWKMHEWLFARGGRFTAEELAAQAAAQGLDARALRVAMDSPQVTEIIRGDADLAHGLGIWATPLVFINGVELRGWNAPDAFARAAETLFGQNAPALSPEDDHPMQADEKYVADWRVFDPRPAPGSQRWVRGEVGAPVRVLLFGEVQESATGRAHADIVAAMAGRPFVSYEFRFLPVNKECNPTIQRTGFPAACLAAYAAEAAGRLGGAEAFWRMLEWLVENREPLADAAMAAAGDAGVDAAALDELPDEQRAIFDGHLERRVTAMLREAAAGMGLDAEAFERLLADPSVRQAPVEDVRAARSMGVDRVPVIFVNGRWVYRWPVRGADVLSPILEAARAE